MKKRICDNVVRMIILFIIVLTICTLFKVFACALPSELVQDNIEKSRLMIERTGDYPQLPILNNSEVWAERGMTIIDYYTEWMALNMVYSVDSEQPLQSAMKNTSIVIDYTSTQANLLDAMNNNAVSGNPVDAVQYWIGSLSIIRVLLCFFDYSQIIILFQCVFFACAGFSCVSIYKRCGNKVAIPFIVSLLCTYVFTTSFMFHYGMVFIIAFIAIIFICNKCNRLEDLYGLFLVLGMLTAYFDWLSTPSVSCTLPLVVAILITYSKSEKEKKWLNRLLEIIINGISWCIGYAGMLISKWLISAVVLDIDVWQIVNERILSDTKVPEGINRMEYYSETVQKNIDMLLTNKLGMNWIWTILFVLIIVGVLANIYLKNKNWVCAEVSILAIVPFAWCFVFSWHSNAHYWFTYRNFSVSVFVIFLIINILWKPIMDMKNGKTILKEE